MISISTVLEDRQPAFGGTKNSVRGTVRRHGKCKEKMKCSICRLAVNTHRYLRRGVTHRRNGRSVWPNAELMSTVMSMSSSNDSQELAEMTNGGSTRRTQDIEVC